MVKYLFVIFFSVVILFEVGDMATGNHAAVAELRDQIDCFTAYIHVPVFPTLAQFSNAVPTSDYIF